MRTIATLRQDAALTFDQSKVRLRHLIGLAALVLFGALAWLFGPAPAADGSNGMAVDVCTAIVWLGAIAVIVLLGFAMFVVVGVFNDPLHLLAAMRRPLAVALLAATVLFYTGQGQELGSSLMIGVGDWVRALFVLMILVYWALNNWHSARLGLWRAANPDGAGPPRRVFADNTPGNFWGPALMGVSAHLLAAVSLGIAAWKQPDFGDGLLRDVAPFAATAIIIVLTGCVYFFHRAQTSQSDAKARRSATAAQKSNWPLLQALRDFAIFVWRRSWKFLIRVTALLAIAAIGAYLAVPEALKSFVVGSLAISESAVVYLTIISAIYSSQKSDASVPAKDGDLSEKRILEIWTTWLFLIELPAVLWTWWDAASLGRWFGSMAIALFTFGALLATVNGVEQATDWAGRRLFVRRPNLRVFQAYATVGVLTLCFVNASLHPFHAVRPCRGGDCLNPKDRVRVQSAADLWYDQARAAYTKNGGGADDKVPMLIVATAGGGIRAGYWTATVLDQLEMDLAGSGGARPYLFAISGVSGGSVGATAFTAALAVRDSAHCHLLMKDCPKATSYLNDDYFAPTLAAWIYKDVLATLWPIAVEDRAGALERSLEFASNGVMGRSFLSFFNPKPEFKVSESRTTWNPILLLNATHEETGKRIIASQVAVERDVFVDAYDELDVVDSDLRASTAAVNSARFFYVSPAGNLGKKRGSVIDGGYYENYGALTALELARAAGLELGDKVKLVILMITSDPELGNKVGDPDLDKSATLVRIDQAGKDKPCVVNETEGDSKPGAVLNFLPVSELKFENVWLNEFVAPLQGISKVREAHGNRAAAELAGQICADFPKPTPVPASADAKTGNATPGVDQASQRQISQTLTAGRGVIPSQTEPVVAKPDLPYFAHVGMCEADRNPDGQKIRPLGLTPPLGWVLSQATRDGIAKLVFRCGNEQQFTQLERALSPSIQKAEQ